MILLLTCRCTNLQEGLVKHFLPAARMLAQLMTSGCNISSYSEVIVQLMFSVKQQAESKGLS